MTAQQEAILIKDFEGTVYGSSGKRGGMPGPMATSHLRFVGYGPPEARSSPASKPTTYACRISTVKPVALQWQMLFIWLEATMNGTVHKDECRDGWHEGETVYVH